MTETPTPHLFDARTRHELVDQRVLVLDGALDDDNGTLLMTQLMALAAADPDADIALWIHSPGGSVPAMLAIRDIMHLVPNDVSTLALGLAAAQGSSSCRRVPPASGGPSPTPGSCSTRGPPGSVARPSTSNCRPTTCGTPATPCST